MKHIKIDWESQWAQHSPGYREGYLYLDLRAFGFSDNNQKALKLKPGPGFGDLSHPTTRLMLKLMAPLIQGKTVVDIGCGSGILSLAAAAMGAASVCGIDIDDGAIEHSRLNCQINGFEQVVQFCRPEKYRFRQQSSLVLLINMIQSEQQVAWNSLPALHGRPAIVVASGVLAEGKVAYLQMCQAWGWHLLEEKEEGGWLGFVFEMD